jgi:hypothetical protein
MNDSQQTWNKQKQAWKLLKGISARSIDLDTLSLLTDKSKQEILQPGLLEALLCEMGLNDEGMNEFPAHLHTHCGRGLLLWQYPIQFAPYLRLLARLRVRSYMEIGIRHGGSYVMTTELLKRFSNLEFAIGVDVLPCPSMAEYESRVPVARFECINSRGKEFSELVKCSSPIDLVFIDSHHEEDQCRLEFDELKCFSNMIAFHDITNKHCPGIARVWQEIKSLEQYQCFEFVEQYEGLGPYMGIGLAVKVERMNEVGHELEVSTG